MYYVAESVIGRSCQPSSPCLPHIIEMEKPPHLACAVQMAQKPFVSASIQFVRSLCSMNLH